MRPNKLDLSGVIKPGVGGLKNLEREMEASRAWGPNELGPHYDDAGKRQMTRKELRLEEEKQQRAKRFMDKVQEYRSRRDYAKGGMV